MLNSRVKEASAFLFCLGCWTTCYSHRKIFCFVLFYFKKLFSLDSVKSKQSSYMIIECKALGVRKNIKGHLL